ncbi:MAG: hypothetical protein E7I62_19185, partial [Bilophila wadsworthia]|uniref:hypothetical protein n=1 Tax=Bilophila wadsworthia TaxID=35833 RepID=UPI00290B197D
MPRHRRPCPVSIAGGLLWPSGPLSAGGGTASGKGLPEGGLRRGQRFQCGGFFRLARLGSHARFRAACGTVP